MTPSELGTAYLKPSAEHLLGTNDLGQDIFSEMIYGTRVSLLLGVFSALLVSLIGTAFALIAGYFGGTADKTICAVIDVVMAVPSLAADDAADCLPQERHVQPDSGDQHHRMDGHGTHPAHARQADLRTALYQD